MLYKNTLSQISYTSSLDLNNEFFHVIGHPNTYKKCEKKCEKKTLR